MSLGNSLLGNKHIAASLRHDIMTVTLTHGRIFLVGLEEFAIGTGLPRFTLGHIFDILGHL